MVGEFVDDFAVVEQVILLASREVAVGGLPQVAVVEAVHKGVLEEVVLLQEEVVEVSPQWEEAAVVL